MSARRITPTELLRCECGALPQPRVQDAGEARIFWFECECGERTAKSDYYPDVLTEWNDRQSAAV